MFDLVKFSCNIFFVSQSVQDGSELFRSFHFLSFSRGLLFSFDLFIF